MGSLYLSLKAASKLRKNSQTPGSAWPIDFPTGGLVDSLLLKFSHARPLLSAGREMASPSFLLPVVVRTQPFLFLFLGCECISHC